MPQLRKYIVLMTLFFSFACIAKADPFNTISFDYTITKGDKSQLGRPSRNSIPQTYAGNETYPGIVNATTTYYYQTFTFSASLFVGAPYIDIQTFDQANLSNYFLTAYANAYDPNSRATNWLGDIGFSGNYQLYDGGEFNFVLPKGDNLVLVLNSTIANGVPTEALTTVIQGFGDTMYGDPIAPVAVTPEPSSLILAGTGLLSVVGAVRRRRA